MATNNPMTAAMLYDLVQCPHRPTMDLFGNPAERDEINPIIQLLWKKGNAYEAEVVAGVTALNHYSDRVWSFVQ